MENEFNPSPTTEPTNDYELDPYHKRDSDFIKETFRQEEEDELTESIENFISGDILFEISIISEFFIFLLNHICLFKICYKLVLFVK